MIDPRWRISLTGSSHERSSEMGWGVLGEKLLPAEGDLNDLERDMAVWLWIEAIWSYA